MEKYNECTSDHFRELSRLIKHTLELSEVIMAAPKKLLPRGRPEEREAAEANGWTELGTNLLPQVTDPIGLCMGQL